MQVVEYQRSMGSHTTAIGAHETSFHCIGEDIHVIHSRVVDTELGIDIESQEIVHHAVLKPVLKYRPGYIATISLRIN